MADFNVNDLTSNANSIKSSMGWATERTLQELVGSANASEDVLKRIAGHFQISLDGIRQSAAQQSAQTNAITGMSDNIDDLTRTGVGAQREFIKATKNLSDNFTKEFMNAKGDQAKGLFEIFQRPLDTFSSKIQFINTGLYKYTKAMGGVFGLAVLLVGRFQEINDTLKTLYATGARLDLKQSDLIEASTSVGLTLTDFSKILTKYSNVAVALGVKRTVELSKKFAEQTKLGSDLMMNQEEAQNAFMDTMTLMQNAGTLRNKTDAQVVEASKQYLSELNDLSAATGKNREEIRKATLAASQTPAVYTAIRMLPDAIRDNFTKIMQNVSARFGQSGSAIMDEVGKYMAGGVGMMGKEYQLMFSQLGGGLGRQLQAVAEATKRGDIEGANRALEQMTKTLHNLTPEQQRMIQIIGKTNPAFQQLIVKMQQDTQVAYDRMKAMESMTADERKRAVIEETRQKENQKAFNEAQKAISGLRNTIDGLIGRLGPVIIPALDLFAQGISALLDKFNWAIKGIEKVLTPVMGENTASVAAIAIGGLSMLVIGKILKTAFTMLAGGGGSLLRTAMGPLGGLLGGAGAAAGRATGGMLSGVASGLSALGNPRVFMGIAALAAIGGALWVATKALAGFAALNWETLGKAGAVLLGMGAIGAVAGAAAPLLITGAVAIGILGVGLIPFAFALNLATPAIEAFGSAIKMSFEGLGTMLEGVGKAISNVIDSVTRMRTGVMEQTTEQIERLSKLPSQALFDTANGITALKNALEDFQPGILAGFSQFMGSFLSADPVERLQKLANLGSQLGTAAVNIERFRSAIGPLIGQQTVSAQTPATTVVNPTITTDQLNTKTLEYYENSMNKFTEMVDKMDEINRVLESIRSDNDGHTRDITSAVYSTGQTIR